MHAHRPATTGARSAAHTAGQKLLLGALAHDNGSPALLLSYNAANGDSEEAQWALPVECGSDICSYQARAPNPNPRWSTRRLAQRLVPLKI